MKKYTFIWTIFVILSTYTWTGAYGADTKTTALSELTDAANTDIIYIVDDPGGTPLSKKITILNLLDVIDISSELLSLVQDETGTGVLVFATSPIFTTSILAASQADIGSTTAEFGDMFIGDGKIIKFGDDQDVTLTHVADTGLLLNLELEIDGTLDADGAVTLGDGGDTVTIDSSDWDIGATGIATGMGNITSDGVITSIGYVAASAATNPLLDLNPAHTNTATIIDITPSAVISTNEADWIGITIDGAALDPSGDDVTICGMNIDLSGVVPSGSGGNIEGIKLQMVDGAKTAVHIEEGKVTIDNTAGSAAGAEYTVVDIRLDTSSLHANSDIHAIDVAVEAGTPSGDVVAVGTHSNVTPIRQAIGTFSTPNQTEYAGEKTGGGASWIDGVDANEIFVADDDEVYVGSAATFNEIEVAMTTPGTKNVSATFHYNTAADAWTEFFPADDTDGFQQDGTIRWTLADISGSWTNNGDPGGADSSPGYWIKIVRTANADPVSPTPTTVKTGVITTYFWDKTGAIDLLSAEANTITEGGVAVHNNDQMDTSPELRAIFDDETGTGVIVFGTNPTLTGATLAGILADNDDMVFECDADNDGSNKYSFTNGASAEILSVTEAGLVSSATFSAWTSVLTPLLDAAGAEDMDYGSADVTDHTFTTDGTGTAEIVFPAGSIDGTEILDDTVDSGDYAAGSIDYEHLADDAISGAAAVGTFESGDTFLVLEAGVGLREADFDDLPGVSTAWDDIGDPDNSGLTTVTFDNAELTLLTGDNDAAASFITIQNSDADHTGGNLYLLDLDYSADDGDVDADFIKCQDSGSVVFSVQQDGELATDGGVTAGGTIEGATLTEGGQAVWNATETDILDSGHYIADSIDNEHINWADIDNLGDEGAVTLAGLATTLTITDNESTAENNALIFTSGGDLDGGDLGLECDGTAYYTPSTGTITTTEFVGGGAGVASVDAITGDSATAFFDAGTIEHEYGGLELDVSGYSGLVAIASGSTAEVDSLDELEAQLADVTRLVSEAIMPVAGTDPDVDAAGEVSVDTDGANEPNDVVLRTIDGTGTQTCLASALKHIHVTLISPDTIDAADLIPIWHNTTGMTFTIVQWKAWSDDDDVSLEIEELTDQTDYTAITTVDAVEIATDGTGVFYASDTTITHAAIEHDHSIAIDFDATDTPDYVQITISGWFNSDVN